MASKAQVDTELKSNAQVDIELKSNAQEIWKCINDFPNLFPKALPQVFESVEVLEGDGNSAGSVRLVTFGAGPYKTLTEKIESVDDNSKIMSYSYVSGDALKYYKNFLGTFVVNDKDDGTVVNYSCEAEKLSEQTPDLTMVADLIFKSLHGLDAYLLSLKA